MKLLAIFTLVDFMLISSCDPPLGAKRVYSITIENSSQDTLYFYESYGFPDSSIATVRPHLGTAYPNDISNLDSDDKWEKVLTAPNDTLTVFFLNKTVVDSTSWARIRNEYLLLKRVNLSLEDLKEMNWTIKYP